MHQLAPASEEGGAYVDRRPVCLVLPVHFHRARRIWSEARRKMSFLPPPPPFRLLRHAPASRLAPRASYRDRCSLQQRYRFPSKLVILPPTQSDVSQLALSSSASSSAPPRLSPARSPPSSLPKIPPCSLALLPLRIQPSLRPAMLPPTAPAVAR